MIMRKFFLKDGIVVKEEYDVDYEFTNKIHPTTCEQIVVAIPVKLSEKVCEEQRILELFSRRQAAHLA